MAYDPCVELQRSILEDVVAGHRRSTLLLVEHEPVLTLGAAFQSANLLLAVDEYDERGIAVRRTDRGGDVTYHGPGQLVAYPIFDLRVVDRDLHRWLRMLEDVIIATLRPFGLNGARNRVNTGVWIENRKICAIGIKVRRWVSMHGLALNCDVDLTPFSLIVPCGIAGDYGVTSVSAELGRHVGIDEVKPRLVEALAHVVPSKVAE
jgi:lipoyl(octanoyl) transferase